MSISCDGASMSARKPRALREAGRSVAQLTKLLQAQARALLLA